MKIRATFVMEQHLGHYSYYQNLRRSVDRSSRIEANWVGITYRQTESLWSRLPGLPQRLRGALIGRSQVLQGLRRQAYDVAVFNTQVPAVLGGKIVQQKPYGICTDITPIQYDRMAEDYGHTVDRILPINAYKHNANTRTFRGSAFLFPWSNWAAESLVHDYGVHRERIRVIAPGVDIQAWHPGPHRQEKGRVRILFVGGDFYRKGGQALLDAYRSLPPGLAELVLVTRSSLEACDGITVLNDVQPNSERLISLYQSCDIFILPSRAEAFGIAAVEASAAGLPVIATAVGGLTDIVANQETGFLIPPGDEKALVSALHCLCENAELREKLGQNGRARAEARFDALKNAGQMINILEWIVYEN